MAGKLQDMFRGLTAAARDVDTRGNLRTGSLLLDGLTVAGD